MEGNEVMNQYMDKWIGNDKQYNLNQMFYYVYQSFLIHPPVGSGVEVQDAGDHVPIEKEPEEVKEPVINRQNSDGK